MKRIRTTMASILLIVMAFTLSGCGSFEARIARAASQMQKLDSMHMDIDLQFSLAVTLLGESVAMDYAMDIESDMFTDPLLARMDMTLQGFGESLPFQYYMEEEDGIYTLYFTSDGGDSWQKQNFKSEEYPGNLATSNAVSQLALFSKSAKSFREMGTESINGSAALRYDGVLEGEIVSEALTQSGVAAMLSEQFGTPIDMSVFAGTSISASIWIDQKTGMIVRYDLDLTEAMNDVLKMALDAVLESAGVDGLEGLTSSVELKDCLFSTVLSQFDAVERFEIPAAAKAA